MTGSVFSGCKDEIDCPDGMREFDGRCIPDTDCPPGFVLAMDPTRCVPISDGSVGCSSDADCTDDSATLCDEGICVECTADDESACGDQVCDLAERRCSSLSAASAGSCDSCVSDRQCRDGLSCVDTEFDSVAAGRFCMWRLDSTVVDGDCGAVRPFIESATGESVSGERVNYCRMAISSCPATDDHGVRTCAAADECGVSGVLDALCLERDAGDMVCSLPCRADGDCPPTLSCDMSSTPFHCTY